MLSSQSAQQTEGLIHDNFPPAPDSPHSSVSGNGVEKEQGQTGLVCLSGRARVVQFIPSFSLSGC